MRGTVGDVYTTKAIIDRYRPLVKRSFSKSWKDTGKFNIERIEDINRHANQPKAEIRNYLSGSSIR